MNKGGRKRTQRPEQCQECENVCKKFLKLWENHDTIIEEVEVQVWFIGRTLASQAGETGSTPATCFAKSRKPEIDDSSRESGCFWQFFHRNDCVRIDLQVRDTWRHMNGKI